MVDLDTSGMFAGLDRVEGLNVTPEKTCDEFKATPDELRELARYWAELALNIRLFSFVFGQYSGSDTRLRHYAHFRLEEIDKVLGHEAVDKIVADAEEKHRRHLGKEKWRVFKEGTEHERDQVVRESYRGMDYLTCKRRDEETAAKAFAALQADPCGFYLDDLGDLWTLSTTATGPEDVLMLRVTTKEGVSGFVQAHTLPRPPSWYPPFGIG